MFTIESNVSPKSNSKYKQANETIAAMKIGQSFVMPAPGLPSPVYTEAKRLGVKITIRKESPGFYRIHRIG